MFKEVVHKKMLISTRCIHGFMSNLIKKSWTDPNLGVGCLKKAPKLAYIVCERPPEAKDWSWIPLLGKTQDTSCCNFSATSRHSCAAHE